MESSTGTAEACQTRFDAGCILIREAGALAMTMRPPPGSPTTATLKGRQDYVTEADSAVQTLIAKKLEQLFPNDGFLGEEKGTQKKGYFHWVLDPIDGTSNYARGRERWCISLALFQQDIPIVGLIFAPTLDDLFTAQRGKGAFLNGQPIQAATTENMNDALIEIGWSPHVPASWFQEKTTALLSCGAMPRSLGSGALALADVACGRSDGYLEKVIYLWDVAAALVLLREAGAHVSPFLAMGGMTRPVTILAGAPAIAPCLSEVFEVPLS